MNMRKTVIFLMTFLLDLCLYASAFSETNEQRTYNEAKELLKN